MNTFCEKACDVKMIHTVANMATIATTYGMPLLNSVNIYGYVHLSYTFLLSFILGSFYHQNDEILLGRRHF